MLPLLALIPGLLLTGIKYLGPIADGHKDQIAAILLNVLSKNPTGKKIVDAFESVLGPLNPQASQDMTMELDAMLGQIDLNKIDESSIYFLNRSWRPFLAWGLAINIILHCTIITVIDILQLFGYNPPTLTPLDTITLTLMCGLLGIGISARTIEKYTDTTGN